MQNTKNTKRKVRSNTKNILLLVGFLIFSFLIFFLGRYLLNSDEAELADRMTETNEVIPNPSLDNSINFEPSSPSENDSINDKKNNADKPAVDQPTEVTSTITTASVYGDVVRVRVLITGASSGNCRLNLSHSGVSPIIKEANVVLKGSQYSCDGFDIPRTEFLVNGTWKAIITISTPSGETTTEANLEIGA